MRLFPFLLFLIAGGELYGYYLALKYKNSIWFYNIFDPIMYLFYFAILYFSIYSLNFRRFIIISSIFYIILSSISYYYIARKGEFNQWMYLSGVIILVLCLIRKLYELLEDPKKFDFLKNPFFYILLFTLFFYTLTMPRFVLNSWLTASKSYEMVAIVNNVSRIFNLLLYAAYTIAFLWIRKTGLY